MDKNKREFKIKILEAFKEGKISKLEAKDLLANGYSIPPIAWVGTEEKHTRILDLMEVVFERELPPRITWVK